MALDKNLNKLSRLLSLMDEDTLTKEMFLTEFKKVIDLVLDIRKENKATAETLNKAFDTATKSLSDKTNVSLVDVKSEITKALGKSSKELSDSMNFIRDKVRKIKIGEDGHTPTNNELLALIQPLIPKIPDAEKPDLERFDEEDERVNDKIEELEKKIDELPTRRLGGTGGDANVAYSLNRLVKSETPVGNINGSNTAYTLTRVPKAILSFYINGMFIHPAEYTQSGTTITFSTALPSSLSGKGFTITFV